MARKVTNFLADYNRIANKLRIGPGDSMESVRRKLDSYGLARDTELYQGMLHQHSRFGLRGDPRSISPGDELGGRGSARVQTRINIRGQVSYNVDYGGGRVERVEKLEDVYTSGVNIRVDNRRLYHAEGIHAVFRSVDKNPAIGFRSVWRGYRRRTKGSLAGKRVEVKLGVDKFGVRSYSITGAGIAGRFRTRKGLERLFQRITDTTNLIFDEQYEKQ